jgi:hypothetical protein
MPVITVRDDYNTLISFVDGLKINYQIPAENYFKEATYLAIDLDGVVVYMQNLLTGEETINPRYEQTLITCLQEIAVGKNVDR